VLSVQVVRQADVPQTYGEQLVVAGVAQLPVPVQWETGVYVPPLQEVAPQLMEAAAFWQLPSPSQVPTKPQGGAAGQPPCGSLAPAGDGWQVPALPVTLHW